MPTLGEAQGGLPRVSGKEVVRALERLGWRQMRSSGGNHVKLERPDRHGRVVVPVHGARTLPLGTLKSILDQAGLTAAELKEVL